MEAKRFFVLGRRNEARGPEESIVTEPPDPLNGPNSRFSSLDQWLQG